MIPSGGPFWPLGEGARTPTPLSFLRACTSTHNSSYYTQTLVKRHRKALTNLNVPQTVLLVQGWTSPKDVSLSLWLLAVSGSQSIVVNCTITHAVTYFVLRYGRMFYQHGLLQSRMRQHGREGTTARVSRDSDSVPTNARALVSKLPTELFAHA